MHNKPTGILAAAAILVSTLLITPYLKADELVDLDKIVVTPYRYQEQVHKTASQVSIITQEQIQNSNAQTITDVLKTQAGLTTRDFYGNGAKSVVDIRGFGEFATVNTAVLVDGRKVNEVDVSGVAWSQIPLNNVERIEIVRGSSAGVLYGDNAVAGAINIVTKKGAGKPKWRVETMAGSYNQNKQDLSVSGSENRLTYFLSTSRDSTHGYRDNSFYKSADANSNFTYDINNANSLRLSSSYHKADFGLPGELSDAEILATSRRSSKYCGDHATETDWFTSLGGSSEILDDIKLDMDLSYRRRQVYTSWLVFFGGWGSPIYKDRIDTVGFTPKFIVQRPIGGHDNKLVTGIDLYRSDYRSNNYNYSDVLQSSTNINKISRGYYLQDEFSILNNLFLVGGYRYEKATYEFDYHNAAYTDLLDNDIAPSKRAYNCGLAYKYKDDSSVFINTSQSLRFPATDEYSITWPVHSINTALKPQTSHDYELGVRHRFNPDLKTELSLFRMDMRNELYYDYASYSNKNYDDTRHEGIDTLADLQLNKMLGIWGAYTYTKAYFTGGTYNNKTIPMVANHKASLGLRYQLLPGMALNTAANYVGKRYFINDQANTLSRLNGYVTVDSNLAYTYKNLTATIGVNNILDKQYSEYATCNPGTGKKVYYPSPERNYFAKLACEF